jgi:mycothiol synthase
MEGMPVQGLTMRPATMNDIDILYGLSHDYDVSQYGADEYTREDLQNIFSEPQVSLEHDTCLVFDLQGRLVGSLFLNAHKNAKFLVLTRVHPDFPDPHLGDYLLGRAEERARVRMAEAEPGVRVTIDTWAPTSDLATMACYGRAGLREARRHWRMEIELDAAPAPPIWPAHIEVHPFVPERDGYAVYHAIEAAFTDHWGHVPHSFEQWQHWSVQRPDFDPTLWFIAREGAEVAGGSLCLCENHWGWVNTLGVVRPWRQRGLGMALLQYSFGEFYRRGLRRAGLSVDSQNLTGAVRLYYRAGMHVARETITYEKELRAGVEVSTQTLTV